MPEELRARIAAAAAGNPLFISEMLAMTQQAGDRRRGAAVVEGAAGGAARPARPGRAAGAGVRLGRGRGLPPRRRPSVDTRGGAGDATAGGARAARADPLRPAPVRRRGRLPLPPPPDPRHRLRRPPEKRPGQSCTSASPPGSKSTARVSSSSTRSSATTSNRPPATWRELGQPDPAPRRACRRAARGRRPPRALARRRARRRRSARAGARADPADAARRRARTRPRRDALSAGQLHKPQRSPTQPPNGREQQTTMAGEALARVGAAYYRTFFAANPAIDELEATRAKGAAATRAGRGPRRPGASGMCSAYGVANWRCRFEDYAYAAEQALHHAGLAGHRSATISSASRPRLSTGRGRRTRRCGRSTPPPREPAPQTAAGSCLAAHDARPLRRGSPSRRRGRSNAGVSSQAMTGSTILLGDIAATAGDHENAAVHHRRFCELSSRRGVSSAILSTYAPRLGRSLCALGRYDEAEPLAQLGRKLDETGARPSLTDTLAAGTGARPREPRPTRRGGGRSPARPSRSRNPPTR